MRISDWSSDVCSSDLTPEFTGAMRVLAGLLEARTGKQLAINRIWRIETALKPLLRANGMATLEDLVSQLLAMHDRHLLDTVTNCLRNNESSFFRDRAVFVMIEWVVGWNERLGGTEC